MQGSELGDSWIEIDSNVFKMAFGKENVCSYVHAVMPWSTTCCRRQSNSNFLEIINGRTNQIVVEARIAHLLVIFHRVIRTEIVYEKKTNEWKSHTRTMIPLKLAWAWTIWKAQGQTIKGKIVFDLGDEEKEHGLAYVALSRATKLSDIGIIGLSGTRLTTQISRNRKVARRLLEDVRLHNLGEATLQRLQIDRL